MSNIESDIDDADKAHNDLILHKECKRILGRSQKIRRGKKFRAPRPDAKCPAGFVKRQVKRKDAELRRLCGL